MSQTLDRAGLFESVFVLRDQSILWIMTLTWNSSSIEHMPSARQSMNSEYPSSSCSFRARSLSRDTFFTSNSWSLLS